MTLVQRLVLMLGLVASLTLGQTAGIIVYTFGKSVAVAVSSGAGACAVALTLFFAGVAAFK